jgi:hypothetical protein
MGKRCNRLLAHHGVSQTVIDVRRQIVRVESAQV